ncbi:MAG: HD-GYP domain-containing protein [Bdellovibrionales bacterium]|nr:HD-GYP domain-containing protein [Bdellovibrionales bacterium]
MNPAQIRRTFLNHLFLMLKTAQIHDPNNQTFKTSYEQLMRSLKEILSKEQQAKIEVVEKDIYLNQEKVRNDITSFAMFQYILTEFEQKNIGGLEFFETPSFKDLSTFFAVFFSNQQAALLTYEDFNKELDSKGISSISVLEKTNKKSVSSEEASKVVSQKKAALNNYVKAIDVVKKTAIPTSSKLAESSRMARRVVYQLVDICLDEGFSFFGLSNIKNYDEYTFNHSVNVCIIAIGFGKNLGLNKKQIGELGVSALFHDYGKVMIPREILNKPGKFDPKEWEVMKSHPLQSVKTMLSLGGYQETDIKKLISAFEHHRNYDRSGYPETGLNKPMNFYSKIVAIADAYDAMTTNRVYQKAMLPTIALKILMDNAGTKFDPLLVKAFVNTVGIYPVGSTLELTDGTLAIVVNVHKDPSLLEKPLIKIVSDSAKNIIDNGPEIDLSNIDTVAPGLSISKAVHPEDFGVNVAHHIFSDIE